MALFLAFAAMLLWGFSTFLVARLGRDIPPVSLTLWSQVSGFVLLLPVVALLEDFVADRRNLSLGVVAGIGIAVSVALLYASIRHIAVGIAASISGAISTMVPVLYAIVLGTIPGAVVLLGVVVTVAAVGALLLSPGPEPHDVATAAVAEGAVPADSGAHPGRRGRNFGLAVASLSGLTWSIYYVALDQVGDAAGLWTVMESRVGSVATMLVASLFFAQSLRLSARTLRAAASVGITNALGTTCFVLALGAGGSLVVIVPVSALSPAVSVILARLFLNERLSFRQVCALVGAAVGVLAIVSG